MKQTFFKYAGVSFKRSDVVKLIQKFFDRCLGFAPSSRSFYHIYSYPYFNKDTHLSDVIVNFEVNRCRYYLFLSLDHDSKLELVSDIYDENPCLGILDSWELKDFLDDIIEPRLEKKEAVV